MFIVFVMATTCFPATIVNDHLRHHRHGGDVYVCNIFHRDDVYDHRHQNSPTYQTFLCM